MEQRIHVNCIYHSRTLMYKKATYHLLIFLVLAVLAGCNDAPETDHKRNQFGLPNCPDYCIPKIYNVNTMNTIPNIDGIINDNEWQNIDWSEQLVSEFKNGNTEPQFSSKYKLGINNDTLYFAAIIYDQHIWSVNDICQSYFFDDNFLELFIDDNNTELDYVVLKMNALGNLCGEYRTSTNEKPLLRFPLLDNSLARCAVHVEGTLNNPKDLDNYWAVECAIPLNLQIEGHTFLKPNTQWNTNVRRLHWPTTVVSGVYKKMLNPETGKKYESEKWVWSFLNENSIHNPELWGEWNFNANGQTAEQINLLQSQRRIKWELRNVYYAQQMHLKKHKRYARKLAGLEGVGLESSEFSYKVNIDVKNDTFKASIKGEEPNTNYLINQEGKVWQVR